MKETAGTPKFLLGDHLGSTNLVLTSTGTIESSGKYLPYGRPSPPSGGSVTVDKRFTGHQLEGSLYYMKARFYDPLLGRFLSPDSIDPDYEYAQSLNRYSYVLNNPLRYTDPTGHQYCDPSQPGFDDCVILLEATNRGLAGLPPLPPPPPILVPPPDSPSQYGGSSTLDEAFDCLKSLGPLDCWKAAGLVEEALETADALFGCELSARDEGCVGELASAHDAFQHCYASALIAQELGAADALALGTRHEKGTAPLEAGMDLYNNGIGVGILTRLPETNPDPSAYAKVACFRGTSSGLLITDPFTDPRIAR